MNLENFPVDTIEKISHLSDILVKIGQTPFLRKRLSLYGGTALNLLRIPATYRLSVDLDFCANQRHVSPLRYMGTKQKP